MDVFISFALPALAGLFVGAFSGMLGIGGGTILVPVFRLFFDMNPLASVATSLFTIIPTSLSGAISHIRQKTVHIPLGILFGVSGACTSPLGAWLANISPPWAVMVAAACVIAYAALNMFRKALQAEPRKILPLEEGAKPATLNEAEDNELPSREKFSRKQWLIAVLIGLIAGFGSGYVGLGGGFIMVPLMLIFLSIPMKKASGTSLLAVSILAIPGVIEHASFGNVDFIAGLMVAIGSMPGAVIGAHLLRIVPERVLRFLFSGFLVIAAVLLVYNEFAIIG